MDALIVIAASLAGAIATWLVSIEMKKGPIVGSALVSLIAGIVFYFAQASALSYVPAAVMGASFVGMSSRKTLKNYFFLAAAALIFSFAFITVNPFFAGCGGTLGISACVSTVSTVALIKITEKIKF
ncbi:MAG: hypothetical protein V1911_01795 [Candidatus Micrarchaeota archaeon]